MPRSLPTALALVVLLAAAPLNAQDVFPNRPITIVNPFPPGGQVDIAGRPLAAAMERILEQPVVLVNKPGAAGSSPE
ncbi:MAG: hypothetical protein HYR51_14615 [Candidatus Rokubacteria bacterium]|nr:hypothetical protein [Candidatus Rokubacteria bacterium]